jgi:hypothetical protein
LLRSNEKIYYQIFFILYIEVDALTWKTTAIGATLFFILSTVYPGIIDSCMNEAISETPSTLGGISTAGTRLSARNETEYWGVFVAIADYNGTENDLPTSDEYLTLVADELVTYGNWNKEHMRLLTNEQATKENIIDGLNWLAAVSDENDVVMFSFNGHGTEIVDDNGDEPDGFDEAICPWELTRDSLISDDTLSEKLNCITADGMAIVLDCCLSGEFIEKKHTLRVCDGYRNGLREDITSTNRIILTSAYGNGLAISLLGVGTPCTYFLTAAINKSLPYFALDELLTVEEAFRFAQLETILFFSPIFWSFASGIGGGLRTLIGGLLMRNSDGLLDFVKGFVGGLLFGFAIVVSLYVILEIEAYNETGHLLIPLPQLYDGYPGSLPLGYDT